MPPADRLLPPAETLQVPFYDEPSRTSRPALALLLLLTVLALLRLR